MECDFTVYPQPEDDPYVEKFGDYEEHVCGCTNCITFRTKYDLPGQQLDGCEIVDGLLKTAS
jgi:hypothetical protein